jgi:ABC-type lipoprotein export system ATPase subunit
MKKGNKLKRLNEQEGITLILVTHDPGVAHHAKRVIRIHDGMIQEQNSSHTENSEGVTV